MFEVHRFSLFAQLEGFAQKSAEASVNLQSREITTASHCIVSMLHLLYIDIYIYMCVCAVCVCNCVYVCLCMCVFVVQ